MKANLGEHLKIMYLKDIAHLIDKNLQKDEKTLLLDHSSHSYGISTALVFKSEITNKDTTRM